MSKNTSIALGDHFQDFVQGLVSRGRFGTTSEVIRAGLRLLEEQDARLVALQKAIQEGIDSGPAEPSTLMPIPAPGKASCNVAEYWLRPKARSDIDTIWDYTVKTWGVQQARSYLTG